MNTFGIFLPICFFVAQSSVASGQSYDGSYLCNETWSCAFKFGSDAKKFENFLSQDRSVYYKQAYYSYSQSTSMSQFVSIEFQDMNITKIPSTLFRRFSRMKKLIASDSGISELKSDDLNYASTLEILRLSYNEITQLENVQFIYLKSIKEIDLSHNKISSIHDGAFDKIGSTLIKIDLSYNEISFFKEEFLWLMLDAIASQTLYINLEQNVIREWVSSDKNKSTSAVLNLNLSDNKLKEFKLKNVKVNKLSLKNNEIETFDGNFNSIDISNNKLKKLEIDSDCTSLLASNNQISEIILASAASVSIFDVSHNNLKASDNFHNFLKNQNKILVLDLSYNFFGVFALDDFANMENLTKLSLTSTGLTEIPFGLFAHLQNLQTLDLSQNNLKEINFHALTSLGNLKILKLNGNSLTIINEHEKLKEVMPKLESIGLEDNSWNCEYLSKLKISLSSQGIKIIEPQNRTKSESSVDGIKCIESSKEKIVEVKNGTVDEFVNQKLNEVIKKVNQLDEKFATIKSNETNFMSLIVNNQKEILNLKSDKIQTQISASNFTNTNEVKMLIEQMNNNTMDRVKIVTDQLLHKINELALKIEQNKLENEKMILTSQKAQHKPIESFSPLKSSDVKASGISAIEFFLGILLAVTLTLLIILVAFQVQNYRKKKNFFPRISGRNTPNTVITYDSQSVN